MSDLRDPVLVVLSRHGEGYGLEILAWMREDLGIDLVMTQGRIYPALRSLENEGLLSSRAGPPLPERGGRTRTHLLPPDRQGPPRDDRR